jgi:hypothetical protein
MQDGRPGPKTSAERLDALRKQQLAWSTLDYADVDYTIEVEGGGYWEMEGKYVVDAKRWCIWESDFERHQCTRSTGCLQHSRILSLG